MTPLQNALPIIAESFHDCALADRLGQEVDEVRQALQAAEFLTREGEEGLLGILEETVSVAYENLSQTSLYSWRRLHTDASILCATLLPPLQAIAKLDAAIIISGCAGTGRLDLVLEIIQQLQFHCSERLAPSPLSSSPCYHPIQPLAATSLPTERSIPVLSRGPSLSAFQTQHYQSPFIIRDYASHWPALNEHPWASTQYLRSVAGPGRVVPVEVGRDYRTEDWTQKIMPWDDFLDSLDDHSETTPLYLAQHSLFMQFPALRYDIEVSDYAYAEIPRQGFDPPANEEQLVINAWLGPRNTVSPAHTDPYFNIYVQVVGQKTVWLAPPSAGELMQAEKNTAGIDVFGPDGRPASLDGLGSAAILNPGDLVYIPAGWWHAMRSESVSFSISTWF